MKIKSLIASFLIFSLMFLTIATAIPASTGNGEETTPEETTMIEGIDWDDWLESIGWTFDAFLAFLGLSLEDFLMIEGIDWDDWFENFIPPPPPATVVPVPDPGTGSNTLP